MWNEHKPTFPFWESKVKVLGSVHPRVSLTWRSMREGISWIGSQELTGVFGSLYVSALYFLEMRYSCTPGSEKYLKHLKYLIAIFLKYWRRKLRGLGRQLKGWSTCLWGTELGFNTSRLMTFWGPLGDAHHPLHQWGAQPSKNNNHLLKRKRIVGFNRLKWCFHY